MTPAQAQASREGRPPLHANGTEPGRGPKKNVHPVRRFAYPLTFGAVSIVALAAIWIFAWQNHTGSLAGAKVNFAVITGTQIEAMYANLAATNDILKRTAVQYRACANPGTYIN